MKFPFDIFLVVCGFLSFENILKLCQISREINETLNDSFFKALAFLMYSKEFWVQASMRPIRFSRPLCTWKKEMRRLEYFQETLLRSGGKRWCFADFKMFWELELQQKVKRRRCVSSRV